MSQPSLVLTPPPATEADWAAVSPQYSAHLINGQLHVLPKPFPRHARSQGGLHDALFGPFDRKRGGPGGWLLLMEVDVQLGKNIVAPDLAGWRRERMPSLPDTAPISLAPDWVGEVISPGTEVFDRGEKASWYAKVGVPWLWLVDPEAQTLEVYENDAGQFRQRLRLVGDADVVAPPFEAAPWSLGALWG